MPGPTPSTSTTVTNNTVPQWVSDAGQANYNAAAAMPTPAVYRGTRVAPLSDTTKQSFSFFKDNMNAGDADTAAASAVFKKLAKPDADLTKASGLFNELADTGKMNARTVALLNPYIDNVENKALAALGDQRDQALMSNADKAIAAKAFGGSRSAIVDAVTNAESAKDAGLLSAQLRSSGYDKAAGLARGDVIGAGQGLTGTSAQRTQQLSAAGQGSLAAGDQELSAMLKKFAGLSSIGQTQQGQAQKYLDANMARFNETQQAPIDALNLRLAALGMTPYSTTNNSTTTSTPGSSGFDWGAAGIGGLSFLAGLL